METTASVRFGPYHIWNMIFGSVIDFRPIQVIVKYQPVLVLLLGPIGFRLGYFIPGQNRHVYN